MQVHVERFAGEPVIEHDFSADERFERESGQHVESEAETCDVDHCVVRWKIVEDVAFGFGAEA